MPSSAGGLPLPEFLSIARADDIGPGEVRLIRADGDIALAVCRVGDEYFACADECSHDMAPFDEATLDGYELVCPRHEGRFDVRSGKATRFPAAWPIETFPIRIQDGDIQVQVS